MFGWDGDTLAFESTQSSEARQELQAWRGDSVHYIHEPGSFVPLVQIRQAQAVALSQTTDVKALIAANGGRYDIEQDPLWNGEQLKTPTPFAKEEIAFYQCDHLGTPQELTDPCVRRTRRPPSVGKWPALSAHRLDVRHDDLPIHLLRIKAHLVPRLELLQHGFVAHPKDHGHAGHVQALERAVLDREFLVVLVHLADLAIGKFRGGDREGQCGQRRHE
ncbi:hypothetical protein QFZ47_000531 [Variovorax paradoxus]|nr:hypothetical protein [Variovorax paradoxus]